MRAPDAHERAMALVLRPGERAVDAYEALLAHPDVRAWNFPAPWAFETAGLDLLDARPGLRSIERNSLAEALDALVALATPEALERLAVREWRTVPEPVRQFYLQRPLRGVVASILRVAPKSSDVSPPDAFRETQVFLARFELEYRLDRRGAPRDPAAPAEEGSLIFYPFDPSNAGLRRELGLPEIGGPVLEAYAYEAERERHRRLFEEIARARGWELVDTGPA